MSPVGRAVSAALCVVFLATAHGAIAAPQKLIIQTGWDNITPAGLRANQELVDQSPFNGVVVRLKSSVPEHKLSSYIFADDLWEESWTTSIIEDLQACNLRHATSNFLIVNANPGSTDWFDDTAWVAVVQHWKLAARIASQGRMRGLLFDPEPYSAPHSQFHYAAQAQKSEHSFAQYQEKARQRGREVMTAVQEEYPDITLLCFFMLSVTQMAAEQQNPANVLAGSGYGLFPSFIDGWLDAANPAVTFVDGCESSYHYNSESDYLAAAVRMKGVSQRLVSPENRYKYRAQVQAGFAMYLDAYLNPPTSPWYIDPKGGTPAARLRINLESALRATDQYVWIYGELHNWWPVDHPRIKSTWAEAMPGIDSALRIASDPTEYARQLVAKQAGTAQNLLVNADFSEEKVTLPDGATATWQEGKPPAAWSFWQADQSHGTPGWDKAVGAASPGSGVMTKVGNGCLIQTITVKPGEVYAVTAKRKVAGTAGGGIRVRWQKPEGGWCHEELDKLLYPVDADGEWLPIAGVVTVPEDVGRLVVLLGSTGQEAEGDAVWYDDVAVFKLDAEL